MSVLLVKLAPFLFKQVACKVMFFLGDAIPAPSPFTQNCTQVFAHGASGYFRTKHICWSNAKVYGLVNYKSEQILNQWPFRWEPVFWDSSGDVTPLSLLFGAIQSTQQLSLSLLNVTMGHQVNLHMELLTGQKKLSILYFQVSTVDVNQVDTGGWLQEISHNYSIQISQLKMKCIGIVIWVQSCICLPLWLSLLCSQNPPQNMDTEV